MSLIEKLRQLFGDAKIVWGSSEAKRPFTRRGLSGEQLLKEGKTASRENDGGTKADQSSSEARKA